MRGLTERGVMVTDEKPAEGAVMVTDEMLSESVMVTDERLSKRGVMVTGWGPVLQCGLLTVRGSRDSSPGSTPILGLDSTPIQYLAHTATMYLPM